MASKVSARPVYYSNQKTGQIVNFAVLEVPALYAPACPEKIELNVAASGELPALGQVTFVKAANQRDPKSVRYWPENGNAEQSATQIDIPVDIDESLVAALSQI